MQHPTLVKDLCMLAEVRISLVEANMPFNGAALISKAKIGCDLVDVNRKPFKLVDLPQRTLLACSPVGFILAEAMSRGMYQAGHECIRHLDSLVPKGDIRQWQATATWADWRGLLTVAAAAIGDEATEANPYEPAVRPVMANSANNMICLDVETTTEDTTSTVFFEAGVFMRKIARLSTRERTIIL